MNQSIHQFTAKHFTTVTVMIVLQDHDSSDETATKQFLIT